MGTAYCQSSVTLVTDGLGTQMIESTKILLLHGFASSAESTKARYLRQEVESLAQVDFHAIDFNPTPKDFEYMTITGLINRLRQYVLIHDLAPFSVVGSSFGGLVGLHYAHRYADAERMLLLAPALRWRHLGLSTEELRQWERAGTRQTSHFALGGAVELKYDLNMDGLNYLEPIPPVVPVLIIHGTNDSIVPTADSQAYAAAFPDMVRLVEVDADHNLNFHLALIWEHLQSFLLSPRQGGG